MYCAYVLDGVVSQDFGNIRLRGQLDIVLFSDLMEQRRLLQYYIESLRKPSKGNVPRGNGELFVVEADELVYLEWKECIDRGIGEVDKHAAGYHRRLYD